LLAAVPEERREECWWLVLADGLAVAGYAGGSVMLCAAIHVTKPFGRVLRALRLSRLLDTLDKLVARYRKDLGRLVPDGPAPRRYP